MIGLIDIGGTKLLASVTGEDGRPGPHIVRPTPREGDPIETLAGMLDDVRDGRPLDAIAMAVPGPFDRGVPALINPPGMSPAWHGADFRSGLGQRFGCSVVAENDANCAALAEAHFGAGRGFGTVVYYTVSTGIGTGVVIGGTLLVSRHDNEGGHQVLWPKHLGGPACDCGGHGCLETLASGRAIVRRFGKRGEELDDDAAWDEIGTWLGLAVVNSTALLDADVVVFGGGVINQWRRLEKALRRTVAASLFLQPAPAIKVAELGVDRNVWGALTLVPGAVGAAAG
jgi:glucokinase